MRRYITFLCAVSIFGCVGGDRVPGDTTPATADREPVTDSPVVNPSSSDEIIVEGVKAEWQLALPAGWIGGNHEQIARVLASSSNEQVKKLSRALLEEARDLDAIAVHLDVDGLHKLTQLRINVIELESEPDWQQYADLEARSQEAIRGEVIRVADVVTGNRRGREAVLGFSRANGTAYLEAIRLVPMPNGRMHLLALTADASVFRQRYREFHNMMASLRYR